MISQLSEIISTLSNLTYPVSVSVREDYEETDITYPQIVVSEVMNTPTRFATSSSGLLESATNLGYQIDIQTQDAVDTEGNVRQRRELGFAILDVVDKALLDSHRLTRGSPTTIPPDSLTLRTIVRYTGVMRNDGAVFTA